MGMLPDDREERFSLAVMNGMDQQDAVLWGGWTPPTPEATKLHGIRLSKRPRIKARIEEMRKEPMRWKLTFEAHSLYRKSMQTEPVMFRGKQVAQEAPCPHCQTMFHQGVYRYDGTTAQKALDMIGREHGVFTEKQEQKTPDEIPKTKREIINQLRGLAEEHDLMLLDPAHMKSHELKEAIRDLQARLGPTESREPADGPASVQA